VEAFEIERGVVKAVFWKPGSGWPGISFGGGRQGTRGDERWNEGTQDAPRRLSQNWWAREGKRVRAQKQQCVSSASALLFVMDVDVVCCFY
jgi:hypothetical protein